MVHDLFLHLENEGASFYYGRLSSYQGDDANKYDNLSEYFKLHNVQLKEEFSHTIKDYEIYSFLLKNSPKVRKEFLDLLKASYKRYDGDAASIDKLHSFLERAIAREVKGIKKDVPIIDFDSLIDKYGNIKRLIYENDRETIDYVRSLGVNFEAYMNLTDPSIVFQGIETLRKNPKLKGKAVYQFVSSKLKENLNLKLSDLKKEDVEIYSDEIALYFKEALSKQNGASDVFEALKTHIQSEMEAGHVSFQLASRDKDDLELGDKCGDCTAKGGMNEDKPQGWVSDVNTQFLKLYYDNRFIGRFNLVLIESNKEPALIIDAIEFIPQAREIEKYYLRAKTAFKEGLKKVKDIARKMGVKKVGAYTFSNFSDVEVVARELGYTTKEGYEINLIRKKPLNKVIGIKEKVDYFLQTREIS
jgi:hypothetical protein